MFQPDLKRSFNQAKLGSLVFKFTKKNSNEGAFLQMLQNFSKQQLSEHLRANTETSKKN